jgi:hypothetical protein
MGKVRYSFLSTSAQIDAHLKDPANKAQWKRHSAALTTLRLEGRKHNTPESIDMRDRVLSAYIERSGLATTVRECEAMMVSDVPQLRQNWNPVAARASFLSLKMRDGSSKLIVVSPLPNAMCVQDGFASSAYPESINIHPFAPCSSQDDIDMVCGRASAAAPTTEMVPYRNCKEWTYPIIV